MKDLSCFGGPDAFCKLKDARIVILLVPYDKTSTWIKGADKGPAAIIEASANMELYDIETDSQVYLKGIFTDKPVSCKGSPGNMSKKVEQRVSSHIEDGKFVVVIGGEHSVSIGAIAAHHKKYKNISVLQLDAHSDLRDEYHNSKYNHACVMARARQLCPIVQVGIRSMDVSEKKNMDRKAVFFAEDIYGDTEWFDKAIAKLSAKVYVTIDLDVFDPSIMPSTGTPEPGGLGWYSVIGFLKEVCKKREVVGFDVVEMCPNPANKGPDFTAAKLIYKLLTYKFIE